MHLCIQGAEIHLLVNLLLLLLFFIHHPYLFLEPVPFPPLLFLHLLLYLLELQFSLCSPHVLLIEQLPLVIPFIHILFVPLLNSFLKLLLVLLLPLEQFLLLLLLSLSHVIIVVLHPLAEVLVVVDVPLLVFFLILHYSLLIRFEQIDHLL